MVRAVLDISVSTLLWIAAVSATTTTSCGAEGSDGPSETGFRFLVQHDAAARLERLVFTVAVEFDEATQRVQVPEAGTGLSAPQSSVLLKVDEKKHERTATITLEGYASGNVFVRAIRRAMVYRGRLVKLRASIGAGSQCGDGTVHVGDEQCDDGNRVDGDGCSTDCVVQSQPGCELDEGPNPRVETCGLNSRGSRTVECRLGLWTVATPCDDPDACIDGTTQLVACSSDAAATQVQVCTEGQWTDRDECVVVEGQCVDGIINDDHTICCAQSCGTCGGGSCATRPGGATDCCRSRIIESRRHCDDFPAPCILN